ncbi:hypothetical protein DSO57_1012428 [Entomophthora muscae]|uniref:Uncharacterized protein n=1 Tax=Entomophthora muscae TaxID=34485 RepID=A0ACC2RKW3_9FUNG|nr:hypothetical protein DSO57_1012428 [Entomophthora muscae]
MPANFVPPPPILENENCVTSQCPEFYAEDALMLSQVIYLAVLVVNHQFYVDLGVISVTAKTLIIIQAEVYTVNLSTKKKDVEHAQSKRPSLTSYHIEDIVYFYSNRGYVRERKLASLWQGPVKVTHK